MQPGASTSSTSDCCGGGTAVFSIFLDATCNARTRGYPFTTTTLIPSGLSPQRGYFSTYLIEIGDDPPRLGTLQLSSHAEFLQSV